MRQPTCELTSASYCVIVLTYDASATNVGSSFFVVGNRNGGRIDCAFDELLKGNERLWDSYYDELADVSRNNVLEGRADLSAYTIYDGEERVTRDHTTNVDHKALTYKKVKRLAKGMY